MNAADFAAYLISIAACEPAREWAAGKTAQEAWDQCERSDWLCWWAFRAGRGAALVPVLYACADRAVREYAPAALRSAGLTAAADKLAALSPVVDATTASYASYAASYASYAASATDQKRQCAEIRAALPAAPCPPLNATARPA